MREPTSSPSRRGAWRLLYGLIGILALSLAACDTVEPGEEARLAVEAFLDAGKPLPALTLRQTRPLYEPQPQADGVPVEDAQVTLQLDGTDIPYRAGSMPGRYEPAAPLPVPPRAAFTLSVQWHDQRATVRGTVPAPIAIDSVQLYVPEAPVQAVLLDSLRLDSLSTGALEGFIYQVEVALWWTPPSNEPDGEAAYWVQTQLKPFTTFTSTVIDFFLLPEQVLREGDVALDGQGRRHWRGVYAVPVETEAAPLPPHRLRVALLRSGQDYARFASSRDAPARREPVSNVEGGLGIVAGISVDSLVIEVQ